MFTALDGRRRENSSGTPRNSTGIREAGRSEGCLLCVMRVVGGPREEEFGR